VPSIVRFGKEAHVKEVDRGRILARMDYEWGSLYQHRNDEMLGQTLTLTLSLYVISLIIISVGFSMDQEVVAVWVVRLICWTIICVGLPVYLWLRFSGFLGGRTVPGLYENGVQMDYVHFLPFSEIERVERKVDERGRESVELHPRFGRKEWLESERHKRPWVLSVKYLDMEGIRELVERVRAAGSPE